MNLDTIIIKKKSIYLEYIKRITMKYQTLLHQNIEIIINAIKKIGKMQYHGLYTDLKHDNT